MKKNRILFAISSLWLGHATRTLPIIKYYLEKWYFIDIISFWNALNFLKKEFKDIDKIWFFELEDYPPLERWKWIKFYFYLIVDLQKTKKLIKNENNFVKKIEKNYDFIISDWRYWVYSKKIPSFLISHQLSFVMPKWLGIFQKISDYNNIKYFKNFNRILIPDYEDKKNNLAWKLSHPSWIEKINYDYIWILSDFYLEKKDFKEKIDYLFTITWYLKESKNSFVNKLIKQAKKLNWEKIFSLWDYSKNEIKTQKNNILIYSNFTKKQKNEFFNKAKVIVSRAGYTTIMDLVELDKKAILFPTPNQTEQEYLAKYLKDYFVIWDNNDFDLVDLSEKIKNTKNFDFPSKTKETLKKIDKIIKKYF